VAEFETEVGFNKYLEQGKLLTVERETEIDGIVDGAEEVIFEGYKCLMVNSSIHMSFIGARLVGMMPPISIIWARRKNRIHISLRSDGTVDVSALAKKYGGGGHPSASGFSWEEDKFFDFQKHKM
jgi:oligoribonuclease NrnB/cAMP/cGMP phosphodiesterase (DHH superfamily)